MFEESDKRYKSRRLKLTCWFLTLPALNSQICQSQGIDSYVCSSFWLAPSWHHIFCTQTLVILVTLLLCLHLWALERQHQFQRQWKIFKWLLQRNRCGVGIISYYFCLLEFWVILPNQVDNQQHSTSLRSCVWILLKAFRNIRNLQENSKGSQTCLSQHQETHTSKRCRKVVFSLVAYTVLGLAIQRTASGGRLLFNSNWGVAVLKSTTTGRLEGLIHSVLPT